MTEAVVVALITGGLSFLGVIYTTRVNHDKTMHVMDTKIALIQRDIQELEKKQSVHNGVIERVYCVEKTVELLDERIKVANHRISDIEKEVMRFNDERN